MPDEVPVQVEVFETIDELVGAISPSETSVIVLSGLPGCGKSSFTVRLFGSPLCVCVAHMFGGHFDGSLTVLFRWLATGTMERAYCERR